MRDTTDATMEAIGLLHDDVERRARALERRHAGRLNCRRGCHDCCVDGIRVFEIEAERIRRHHAALLERGRPHAAGACAFLAGDGSCRIYEHRPYVCRTQGLPLRWLEDGLSGERVEYRDICPLNEDGPPVEGLDPDDCWTLGPTESHLAALEARHHRAPTRVALRDLFRSVEP